MHTRFRQEVMQDESRPWFEFMATDGSLKCILESAGLPQDVASNPKVVNGEVITIQEIFDILQGTGICGTQLINHTIKEGAGLKFESNKKMVFYKDRGRLKWCEPPGVAPKLSQLLSAPEIHH